MNTTSLLNKVKKKLICYERYRLQPVLKLPTVNKMAQVDVEEETSSCYTELNNILNTSNIELRPTSRLMGCLIHLMSNVYSFIPLKKIPESDWPCSINYDGECVRFYYLSHLVDISVAGEKKDSVESSTYFIILEFTHDPLAYEVNEYEKANIPVLDGKCDKMLDMLCLKSISDLLGCLVRNFCQEICNRKSKLNSSGEFNCSLGVSPMFSKEDAVFIEPSSKEAKLDLELIRMPKFYVKLRDRYSASTVKPEGSARLFAIIYEILLYTHQCVSERNVSWPGGETYKNDVITVHFLGKKVKSEETTITGLNVFDVSLLETSNAFYLNVKATLSNHRTIKKISKLLVPTFNRSDVLKEKERINNITAWLGSIIDGFVMKIIHQSYSPPRSIQSASSTEPPSRQGLSDEPSTSASSVE